MIFIDTASTDPAVNLGSEEYFLRHQRLSSTILMLWRDRPASVIGHFQSIFAEVNLAFARAHALPILRRISGCGAVYHGLGNLCFSLMMDRAAPTPSAARLLQPMV